MNTPKDDVFVVDHLVRRFPAPDGVINVLRGVTCRIGPGITAILGFSGSGKTTLLNLLAGLDNPNSGTIQLAGSPVPFGNSREMLKYRSRVSVIWQANNLVGHLTCLDNAALPLTCRGIPRKAARAEAAHFMRLMGLEDKLNWYPHTLSGGQQQRVGIARAFTSHSQVVLADEPTGNLDEKTAHMVMQAFWTLANETGTPSIVVTHNQFIAQHYCDGILELRDGVIARPDAKPDASPP